MAFKLLTAVLALFLLVQVKCLKEYSMQTNCISNSNSCRTFNDYANDADTYFTSDSSFHFMKGTHHLNVTIFIANVVNLSFVGDESDIILSNGCSIIWAKSFELFFTSLNLIFSEAKKVANNSAIHFETSNDTFFNASFFKFYSEHNVYSRAIIVMGSSITFESCKFENGYHRKGGTLYIEDSNVTFEGHNVFLNNKNENYELGTIMYGLRSQMQLSDSVFVGNRTGERINCDSIIYIEFSSISLNGYFKFHSNRNVELRYWCFYDGSAIAASYSSLTLQGVVYFNNYASYRGGAIWLNNSKCLISGHVKFLSNKAFLDGGAISARNSSLNIISSNDFNLYNSSEYISSERFSTVIPQSIIFCNNSAGRWGGAVNLLESNMTLTGSFLFMGNNAQSGGGIAMYFSSDPRINNPNFLVFQESLDITFHENTASSSGGALHINDAYLNCRQCKSKSSTFNCFFKVNGSTSFINLYFTSNKALDGTGIYGGTIQYCQVEVTNPKQRGYQVLQKLMKNSSKIQSIYASCNVYKIDNCSGTISDRVQRGKIFNISVIAVGEFNVSVRGRIHISLYDLQSSSSIANHYYNNSGNIGCCTLGFSILSEYQRERLIIHPHQCLYHPASLKFSVRLDDCPPGFYMKINMCKCKNNIYEVTGHKDLCDSSTGLIKCPQHDWMKPILY